MEETKRINYIKDVLENMPTDWLNLTTHQLDIYNEKLAKTQFLDQFETLFNNNNTSSSALSKLPTAYDYIRLEHPLSLEYRETRYQGGSYSDFPSFHPEYKRNGRVGFEHFPVISIPNR